MKKIIASLLFVLIVATTILLASCNNSTRSQTGLQAGTQTGSQTETIALNKDNFDTYFDVSIEYYNFDPKAYSGGKIMGYYVPGYYEATASQRIKITPKSNVISCDGVRLKFMTDGVKGDWAYSNKEITYAEDTYLDIKLSSNGKYDNSSNVYYHSKSTAATCPVPSSRLILGAPDSFVSGTITVSK